MKTPTDISKIEKASSEKPKILKQNIEIQGKIRRNNNETPEGVYNLT